MQNRHIVKRAWAMLPVRLFLFAGIQALFFLIIKWSGGQDSWDDSANWWPLVIVVSNIICLFLLIRFYKLEEKNYWSMFRFQKETIGKDLLLVLGFLVVASPVAFLPNILLGQIIFGDMNTALQLFIRPLPMWAVITSVALFPISQGLVEIPTYMMFVMPRIEGGGTPRWLSVLLPALFLAAQHIAIPLLINGKFVLWRLLMFLPFALLIALVIKWRPRLLPYLAIIHALMDISTAIMLIPLGY